MSRIIVSLSFLISLMLINMPAMSAFFHNNTGKIELTKKDVEETLQRQNFDPQKSQFFFSFSPNIASIGKEAFACCSGLIEIYIPHTVILIEDSAFRECSNLGRLVLPHCVSYIGPLAFYQCTSLAEITIPSKVFFFDESGLATCESLKKIVVSFYQDDALSNSLQQELGKCGFVLDPHENHKGEDSDMKFAVYKSLRF